MLNSVHLCCLQIDLKIYQCPKELETLSEFIEPLLACTKDKSSSQLTYFSTPHGHYSPHTW
jgi:hypothetical protein